MSSAQCIVLPIKAFNDNYIWALTSNENNNLVLVDPGDAQACITHIEANNLVLSDILVTHHHNDHVGGIKKLLEYAQTKFWSVTVYGPAIENIELLDITLKENNTVNLASLNCQFKVLDLPGHTKGHIAYHDDEHLFCGDTLFSGGCGRLFEGTPAQMHQSLTKLANLPPATLVYCAHEYTQANLNFALAVEPENVELQRYDKTVSVLRQNNQSSIPTNIGLELLINPFLRTDKSSIKLAAQKHSQQLLTTDIEVFTVIRRWKDNF